MNILFIADIVGKPGRRALTGLLPGLIEKKKIDFVVANGENGAGGLGLTGTIMDELIKSGVDVVTSGNHIWKRKDILKEMARPSLLRPANYPPEAPGRGFGIFKKGELNVAVINLQGRVFMEPVVDCPFREADRAVDRLKRETPIIICDIHAEATSEKLALARYLDGRVSLVAGTHTHVQTSDARVLDGGTAFISDAGMTGSATGIIGVEKDEIIKKFITGMPFRFNVARGEERLEGVIADIDKLTGKARKVEAVRIKLNGE